MSHEMRAPDAATEGIQRPHKRAPNIDVLTCLSIACEDRDTAAIDDAMKEIERYEYGAGDDLVAWLRECVAKRDYAAVVEKCTALRQDANWWKAVQEGTIFRKRE